MKKFFNLLKLVKPYSTHAGLNILFNVLSVFFSLFSITAFIPLLSLIFGTKNLVTSQPQFELSPTYIIDTISYHISTIIINHGQLKALSFACALIFCLFLGKNLFRYLAMYFLANVRNSVVKDLRNLIYNKILTLPLSFYSKKRKGDLLTRITADVQEVEFSIMSSLEIIFRDPLNVIIYLVTLFVMSPELTVFILILLPVSGALIGLIGKTLKKNSERVQKMLGKILSISEETIGGLRVIKAFNAEQQKENQFQNHNEKFKNLSNKVYRKRDLASPLSEVMGALTLVTLMWYGGKLVLGENATLAPEFFIGYLIIFSQIIPPAKSFVSAYYNIQKGMASVDRINDVLEAPNEISESKSPQQLTDFSNQIEYKNVSFKYEKETVLNDINLTVNKGKIIALVGSSGAGKSTMADLLPRFYDVTSGEILIDGINIKDYKLKDLTSIFGVVTQESILFNDTVINNIALGIDKPDIEKVKEAAKIANAHEFIDNLEDGYYTNIGDRGSTLSGGQRQRLSIARAILKNPPILILDEATSALDSESEKLVQDAIYKLMQNRTSIVIAHRLSTIQHADEILVMDKGQIVERGTHQQLLAESGIYKKLHSLQS